MHHLTGRTARVLLLVVAVALIVCLAMQALDPKGTLPRWLDWLTRSGDWVSVSVVIGLVSLLCVLAYRSRRKRSSATVPVMIVVGLTAASFVLSFSSFWHCVNPRHPTFFTPLLWTASLVKGGVGDEYLENKMCPNPPPVALDVARLMIIGAIFISLVGVATSLFRAQSDRVRAGLARSATVVVDVDDDSSSIIGGIVRTLGDRAAVVLVTDDPDRPCIQESRRHRARVVQVDFNDNQELCSQRFWRRLNRLYLLSADPSTNLLRLSAISRQLAPLATKRRIPLVMRIDDPWLAEAWRAQQFGQHSGGSDQLWAADAVGKYEVTARRLTEQILQRKSVRRLMVCGTSRLTLALCADLARRQTEREFYSPKDEADLPALILIAAEGDEYAREHVERQKRKGFGSSGPPIEVVAEAPSVGVVQRLVGQAGGDPASNAVIFADVDSPAPGQPTMGTRLAARYPTMPIYAWDPAARTNAEHIPVVGELRNYRLGMDLPEGQAQDNFERAAMLIHEKYSQGKDRTKEPCKPWPLLNDFYKGSNRRQLENALWMVEKIAGHTWNTWDTPPDPNDPDSPASLAGLEPLEQIKRLGFSEDAAYAMAKAEFEDWSRYYRKHGWTYGPRSEEHKTHEKLVNDWAATVADPDLKRAALQSLAGVLIALRELGYRSKPMWDTYRRAGTVTAKRHRTPWTWTSESGDTLHAAAGDWELRDGGQCWSVRDDIFRATYRRIDKDHWERTGTVLARRARPGETIHTLEGPATAGDGDYVIQGDKGEQWPTPGADFHRRYTGPVPVYEPPQTPSRRAESAAV